MYSYSDLLANLLCCTCTYIVYRSNNGDVVRTFHYVNPGCRRRGGLEEERAERRRWQEKEQQKIMDSVRGRVG